MTKKELLEKIASPAIEVVKSEGLVADIDKIYEGNFVDFDKDFQKYFGRQMTPILISYGVNSGQLEGKDKEIALKLNQLLQTLADTYFDEDKEE